MSRAPWSISTVLDWLQAYGEPPAVNPARVKDGALPTLPVPQGSALNSLRWGLLTLVMLLAILLVAIFGPEAGGGFIYEQF